MIPRATALKHIERLRYLNNPVVEWYSDKEPLRAITDQSKEALLNLASGIAELECRHCDAGIIRSVKSNRFYVGGREILVEDCPDCAPLRALLDTFNAEMEGRS